MMIIKSARVPMAGDVDVSQWVIDDMWSMSSQTALMLLKKSHCTADMSESLAAPGA